MTPLDINNIAFTSIVANSNGAKTLPALFENGSNVTWQFEDLLEIPFEPSAYNDNDNAATRVTICLNPSDHVCDIIAALDEWCIQTLSANPVPLLGVQLTVEQIRDRYISCLKTSDKGYKTLRLKMNRSGRYALQCYSPDKEKCAHPEIWRGCSIQPQIRFVGLYLMGRDFGAVMECTHAIVHESKGEACPF